MLDYEAIMDTIPICKRGCIHCNSSRARVMWRIKKRMSSSNRKPWNEGHGHIVHGRRPVKLGIVLAA